ncbi:phosphoglycerate mutase family protein [Diplocarpon mali]|nr:phosphoglycerate mutase family protein [Diplocarpon mali]
MHISNLLLMPVMAATPASAQTVYLIRHGEKLVASQAKECRELGGKRTQPLMTVQPVASDLGFAVESRDRDDADCVAGLVNGYSGSGNIMTC